jgi:uncharacterized protein (DUF2237 family)
MSIRPNWSRCAWRWWWAKAAGLAAAKVVAVATATLFDHLVGPSTNIDAFFVVAFRHPRLP